MVKRKLISSWAYLSTLDNYKKFSSLLDSCQVEIYYLLKHDRASLTNAQGFQACQIMVKIKLISSWSWFRKLGKCTRFSSLLDHIRQEKISFLLTMIHQAWLMHKVFKIVWLKPKENIYILTMIKQAWQMHKLARSQAIGNQFSWWPWLSMHDNCTRFSVLFGHDQEY